MRRRRSFVFGSIYMPPWTVVLRVCDRLRARREPQGRAGKGAEGRKGREGRGESQFDRLRRARMLRSGLHAIETKEPRVRFMAWCLGAPVEVKISTEDVGSGLDACLDKMSVRLLIGGGSLMDVHESVLQSGL